MRVHRPLAALLAVAGVAAVLTACGASQTVDVPDNVPQLMSTTVGKVLTAPDLGYTPVANITNDKHKVIGVIYADCGKSPVNLTQCAVDLSRQATPQRPNVYVVGDKIQKLQGPRVSSASTLNFWATPSPDYQKIDKLTKAELKGLLDIMPQIKAAIPKPGENQGKHVKVLVKIAGKEVEVMAWVG